MRGLRLAFVAVWVLGGALTALNAVDSSRLALESSDSSAVLATIAAGGAMLLAALSYARWHERALLTDLIACQAFSVLAIGNVAYGVVPLLMQPRSIGPDMRAAGLLTGSVAALMFAAAALAPRRKALEDSRFGVLAVLAPVVVACLAVLAVLAFWSQPFPGLSGLSSTEATSDIGSRNVTVLQAVTAGLFAVASLRFVRRGRRASDAFYGWLAITAAFWALARVNYVLTPSHYATWLTVGDWFRLTAYAVAVLGAAAQFVSYWRRAAGTAVLEERRRIARDLHDGLAQELAFITTQSKSLMHTVDDERALLLSRAAERALDESRRAIAALTHPVDEPLEVALAQQAEELSGRLGVRVLLQLDPVGRVSPDTREALLRIAREAITNAGRHGRPSKITVALSNHQGINLLVTDDGKGFLVDDPRVYVGGRYGVTGMKERAEALGGWFRLQSRPYAGTKVEVHLP